MADPLATFDLLPDPARPPDQNLIAATVMIDDVNLEWLDGLAKAADKSRSEALRDILTKVRAITSAPAKPSRRA